MMSFVCSPSNHLYVYMSCVFSRGNSPSIRGILPLYGLVFATTCKVLPVAVMKRACHHSPLATVYMNEGL